MKILAIRGENLTSLGSKFEIDFDGPPLRDCGLFAITGPVGAGKSTLLDALCLALFDRTPRLAERGGALIGEGADGARIGANDVRGVLRRGAGSGFAEVDFRGHSGRVLRARWSVRRARERADGKFQAQSMSLVDCATGQELGGKKTETLAAIEAELGLTFEQFRRSVVLAQNEFAAFLQARSSDRAGLLERMTDTAIYGELSVRAHVRAAELRNEIRSLQRQLDEIEVLEAGARTELNRSCADAESALTKLRLASAANVRREQIVAAVTHGERRIGVLEQSSRELEVAERSALASVESIRREIVGHDEWAARLRPQIRDARAQDQRIQDLTSRYNDRDQVIRAAERALEEAKVAIQTRRRVHELPPGFDEVSRHLDQLIELGHRSREAQSQLDNAEQACESAAAALRRAEVEEASALELVEAAERERAAAPSAERLAECAKLRAGLQRDLDCVGELRSARVREARERELDAEIASAVAAAAEALAESERCSAEAQRGARDLEAARAQRGIAAFAEHLHDGEPCPLCGSLEHPGRSSDGDSSADAARVAELTEWLDEMHARAAAARERARISERAGAAAQSRLDSIRAEDPSTARGETAEDDSSRASEAALAVLRRFRSEASAAEPDLDIDEVLTELRAEIAAAEASEQSVLEQLRVAETARSEFERCRAAWSAARDEVREGRSDVTQRAQRVSAATRERDAIRERESAARTTLTDLIDARGKELRRERVALGGLREELDATRALRQELLGGQSPDVAEEGLRVARADLERRLELARDEHSECDRELTVAKTELLGVRERLAELATEQGVVDREVEFAFRGIAPADPAGESPTSVEDLRAIVVATLDARVADAERAFEDLRVKRAVDDRNRQQRIDLQERVDLATAGGRPRLALGELIGSADGRKFRAFAQGLSFEHLLAHANRHLVAFMPRYRLVRVPGQDLDLQVVDREMGDEIRGVNSLSGGETFVVSLAMALGLASMASDTTAFENLFIDEGLGTLDPASLETVLATLDELQSTGYQIGVISHVEGLAERVAARIEVRPTGVAGRSEVHVIGVQGEPAVSAAT